MAKDTTGVLPYHYMEQIISTVKYRTAAALDKTRIFFTRAEFIEAFIVPEHLQPLRATYELAGSGNEKSRVIKLATGVGDTMFAHLQLFKSPELIVPNYVEYGTVSGSAFSEKIRDWATERRRLGMLVGDAIDALWWLNDHCGNGKAFTLMFPALPAIMVRNVYQYQGDRKGKDLTKEEADKDAVVRRGMSIANISTIGTLPVLPREVVERIREASTLVQILLMAEDGREDRGTDTIGCLSGVRYENPSEAPNYYQRPHIIRPNVTTTTFN